MDRNEVVENLIYADTYINKAFPQVDTVELIIVGGSALLLKGFVNKFTLDIDTVSKVEEQIMEYLQDFAVNDGAVEVYTMPKDFKDRIEELDLGLKTIKVFVPSNEDLVISKVGRLDKADVDDLRKTGILTKVNEEKLNKLGSALAEENKEFKGNWERAKKMGLF